MTLRKTFWFLAILCLIIIIGGYFISKKYWQEEEDSNTVSEVATKEIVQVLNEKLYFPTAINSKEILAFKAPSSKEKGIYKIDAITRAQTKVSGTLDLPYDATWNGEKNRVVIKAIYDPKKKNITYKKEKNTDGQPTFWIYLLEGKKMISFINKITAMNWTTNKHVVYYYDSGVNTSMSVSEYDGENYRILTQDDLHKPRILSNNKANSVGIVSKTGGNLIPIYAIYEFDVIAKKLKRLAYANHNDPKWSPDGKKMIYLKKVMKNNKTYYRFYKYVGGKSTKLKMIANNSHFTWAGNNLMIYFNENTFYRYNLKNDTITQISEKTSDISPIDMFMSPENTIFYFTSGNYLYKIDLS